MQLSKLSSVICAIAVGTSLISVRAQDNAAQAAARAALLEKMSEAEKAPAAPPAVVVTPSGASVEKPAPPAIVQTPPIAQPAPPVASDNAAQAAARAALMEKMNGPGGANAQPPLTIVTIPANSTPPTSPKPMTATPAKVDTASTAAQTEAAAQAAARAKAQSAVKTQKPAAKANDLGMQPLPAPALPISAAKQQQLEALLTRYKADQVTPEEYQTQRAAILAQP